MKNNPFPKILAVSLGLAVAGISAKAADIVHTPSTTGTVNWTAAGWSPAVSDWTTTAGDVARYTLSSTSTYILDTDVTIGSLQARSGGNNFTVASDGTHILTMNGTGLSGANQSFSNAGVAEISQNNSNASSARVFAVGTSATGMTINMFQLRRRTKTRR